MKKSFKQLFSIQIRGGVYFISGKLNFDTVPLLWKQSQKILNNESETLVFDLSKVTQSDSSGVALLIAWIRSCYDRAKKIYFVNLPRQMLAIINLSGLKKIVPIKD